MGARRVRWTWCVRATARSASVALTVRGHVAEALLRTTTAMISQMKDRYPLGDLADVVLQKQCGFCVSDGASEVAVNLHTLDEDQRPVNRLPISHMRNQSQYREELG